MILPNIKEPLLYVDSTPDDELPIRILQVHLDNTACRWASSTENDDS